MNKLLIILMLIVLILAALAVYLYFFSQGSFFVRDVLIEIETPEKVVSGEETIFNVFYQNKTNALLRGVELVVVSEGERRVEALSDILAGEESAFEVPIKLTGQPGEERMVAVNLRYLPDNFSSVFEAKAEKNIAITAANILLSLETPPEVSGGEEFEMVLTVVSKSEKEIADAMVWFDFPVGYQLKKASPPLGEGDAWPLGNLDADQIKTIRLTGVLSGESEAPEFAVRLNDLARTSAVVKITSAPLVLAAKTSGIFVPGEKLDYRLIFINNGSFKFSEAVVEVRLLGDAFDFSTIEATGGTFDKFQNQITWTGQGEPALLEIEPKEEGEVGFSVGLKSDIPIRSFSDKNVSVSVEGKIKTKENVEADFLEEYKLNSRVNFTAKGLFNDSFSSIKNSGPLPPRVGQETTYTIHWQLTNGFNDLENVLVSASLPDGASWTGKQTKNQGKLYYDTNRNSVVWEVVKVPAHTGSLLPTYEAVFQLSLAPLASAVGKPAPILNETIFSARDGFTERTITTRLGSVETDLPDDLTVLTSQGIVIQ